MKKTPELFNQWNEKKKQIEFGARTKLDIKIGDLYRYEEGVNIGNEISKDGKFIRPCLILQNNLGNGLLLILPITSKYHHRMEKYYFHIDNYTRFGLKGEGLGILNQIKLIDSKRVSDKFSDKRATISLIKLIIKKYNNLIGF